MATKNKKQVNEVRRLMARLNDLVLGLLIDSAGAAEVESKAPRKRRQAAHAAVKVKPRDMRCRNIDVEDDADGNHTETRCRARSKGPRFHYLCAEHLTDNVK